MKQKDKPLLRPEKGLTHFSGKADKSFKKSLTCIFLPILSSGFEQCVGFLQKCMQIIPKWHFKGSFMTLLHSMAPVMALPYLFQVFSYIQNVVYYCGKLFVFFAAGLFPRQLLVPRKNLVPHGLTFDFGAPL